MNKYNQFDKKRKSKLQQQNDDDDEQIEKTLNFFDSILDPYLTDQDIINDNHIQKSYRPNGISIRQNGTTSNHVNTPSSSSSSSSSRYIPVPQSRHHSEQTSYVRRHISENNLNQIPSSSKPKISHSRPLRIAATSTEDLSTIPSENRLSKIIKKTNQLSSNGASASLIDLSSIDELSSRPRFRFVPPSNENNILKEEPEIEEEFQLKTIPSDQTSFNQQTKPSHKIVKPTVIIPSVPKSAPPINRLTETNIHHQNENSAFKPHRSKIQQIKLTEPVHKPNLHVGIINSDNDVLPRQQQSHQSMVNLPPSEPVHTNRLGPRTSYQANGYHPSHLIIHEDPVLRWIQHVNNCLVYSENRPQQQNYPYNYIPATAGISPPMNNHRQQTYFNPINMHKYHSPQQPSKPIQPVYIASPPVTRNGIFSAQSSSNVYNFNQNNSPRDAQSKRNPHRQNVTITTYL